MILRMVSAIQEKTPVCLCNNTSHASTANSDKQAHDGNIVGPDDELGSSDQEVEVIERKIGRRRRKIQGTSTCLLRIAG